MGSRAAARAKRQARRRKLAGEQRKVEASSLAPVAAETSADVNSAELPPPPSLPPSAAELSPKQQMAVAALVLGGNVTKTAEEIGVDRRTIQRWMKDDSRFYAVLEAMRREVIVCTRQHLLELAEDSANIVATLFNEKPCPRLALQFLRGLGAIGPEASREIYEPPHVELDLLAEPTTLENAETQQSATLADEAAAEPAANSPQAEWEAEVLPLSAPQQAVLECLAAGKTIAASAARACVKESEVRHWLCTHEEFCMQLADQQFERLMNIRGKLFKLAYRAMDILRSAILGGNGRIGLALLRGLGLFG